MQIRIDQIQHHREILRKRQKDTCPLCGCKLSAHLPSLDHDHKTGAIRDVLCRNCNQVEGRVNAWVDRGRRGEDRKEYLKRLLHYWERHEVNQTGLIHPSHGKIRYKRKRKRKTTAGSKGGSESNTKTTPRKSTKS